MTLFDFLQSHPWWSLVYLTLIIGGAAAIADIITTNLRDSKDDEE